jgi:NADH:ubiquinone oxidoreductase subunit 6 (subunit J)
MISVALYAVAAAVYFAFALFIYRVRTNDDSQAGMVHSDFFVFVVPVITLFIACIVIGRHLGYDKTLNAIVGAAITTCAFLLYLFVAFNLWGT